MTRLVSALYSDWGPFSAINGVNSTGVVDSPEELTSKDILILHGGEDISPSLYNHPVHPYTSADDKPSRRDTIEWSLLQRAIKLNIPILGLCRGAQMLCAAAGGYLIQHVDNHGGYHDVLCADGGEVVTNSCHHQMMYPFDVEHELLMWTKKKLSDRHLLGDRRTITLELECEPEMVYFPKIRGFAMQYHPEWMDNKHPANIKTLQFINERI